MRSAAVDIMDMQHGKIHSNTSEYCEDNVVDRECSKMSTGAVLLADNIPSIIIQTICPFFVNRIPYGFRHASIVVLQMTSFLMVAFSQSTVMSLTGIAIEACGRGLGEITFLSLAAYYNVSIISAWSSGTGTAGLLGSFAYAFLTEPSLGGFSPRSALLLMLVVPVLLFVAYWFILVVPDTVYSAGCHPSTWIVPNEDGGKKEARNFTSNDPTSSLPSDFDIRCDHKVKQHVRETTISLAQKIKLIPPLLHLTIPITLVYIGDHIVNQGLTELVVFDCHNGFDLSQHSQYRWYQVLYQVGTFISRSSASFFHLPLWVVYLLPVYQLTNMMFFFFDALYWFVPHIAIIFGLMIVEGLVGGWSYVNTYNKVYKQASPEIRQYCLSIVSFFYTFGTTFSGFASIPIHNLVCKRPVPHSTGWTTTARP